MNNIKPSFDHIQYYLEGSEHHDYASLEVYDVSIITERTVAVPGSQHSQVISKSLRPQDRWKLERPKGLNCALRSGTG